MTKKTIIIHAILGFLYINGSLACQSDDWATLGKLRAKNNNKSLTIF